MKVIYIFVLFCMSWLKRSMWINWEYLSMHCQWSISKASGELAIVLKAHEDNGGVLKVNRARSDFIILCVCSHVLSWICIMVDNKIHVSLTSCTYCWNMLLDSHRCWDSHIHNTERRRNWSYACLYVPIRQESVDVFTVQYEVKR